jgi:lysophospholipase L1-like esterase
VFSNLIDRLREPRLAVGVAAAVLAVAAVAAGYLIGATNAPGADAARAARERASDSAFEQARSEAFRDSFSRGIDAGLEAGRHAGARQGAEAGTAAGEQTIHDALVLIKQRKAATDAQAQISGPPKLDGSGGVLVVGDSLEVLTSPYLQRYLPHAKLTINAVGGYSSLQIYELFKESYDPSQSVIVFDAGTNDNPAYPQILASRLEAVASTVGSRCMVVPTIHGLNVNGINSDGKNRVVRDFAVSRPGTQVPDWAHVVATHPELMQPDDLHPNPEGAAYRARLIAQSVKACLAGGSRSTYGFGG